MKILVGTESKDIQCNIKFFEACEHVFISVSVKLQGKANVQLLCCLFLLYNPCPSNLVHGHLPISWLLLHVRLSLPMLTTSVTPVTQLTIH